MRSVTLRASGSSLGEKGNRLPDGDAKREVEFTSQSKPGAFPNSFRTSLSVTAGSIRRVHPVKKANDNRPQNEANRYAFTGVPMTRGWRGVYFRIKSGKQTGNGLSLNQFPWLIQMIVDDALGINSETMINRRKKLTRMNGIFHRPV